MPAIFRPTTPADGPAIAALLAAVHHDDPSLPPFESRHYDWKFWRLRHDWPAVRSFVIADGARLLAHAAVVPGRCLLPDRQLDTLHLVDWVARPGAPGTGTALMKHIGRTTDALLAIGGSEATRAILPALGYRAYESARRFVRVVRPVRQLVRSSRFSVRAIARTARDLARNLADVDHTAISGWSRPIAIEDLHRTSVRWPRPAPGHAVLERSNAMLEHLMSCPAVAMTLHEVGAPGSPGNGYFVLAHARGEARIVDAWIDSQTAGDWTMLARLAVDAALQDSSVGSITAMTNDALFSAGLTATGFRMGSAQPVLWLSTRGAEPPAGHLSVQMIDNDFAWLDVG